jgi:hypothetical protein
MPLVPSLTAWMLSNSDRANPMLVRRVRQELRNRASLGAFLLMLLVAVIAAAVASAASGSGAGRGMFAAVASAWTALMCLQANAATRAIATDRGAAAWDLIELTGMPPLRIILGVVQSNLILGLLGAAALAPFLVMSYLLRGLDLPTVLFAIVTLPMAGALLGAIGAALACVGSQRQARQGLGMLMALALIGGWISLTALWVSSEQGLSRWLAEILAGDPEAIMGLIAMLNSWAAALALALALGAALLTHRALDRSSGPRLVWCLIWLNGALWLGALLLWAAISSGRGWMMRNLEEVLAVSSCIGVSWGLVLGLFAISEDIDVTPRQAQSFIAGGRWRRTAMLILGPGATRGARCTLLLIGLSLLLCVPWMPDAPALVLACYGCFTLALGDLVARGPLGRFCQGPVPRRICTIAVLLVIGLLPALAALFAEGAEQRLLLALSPFTGPVDLFSRSHTPSSSPGGYIAFAMGLLGIAWLVRRAASAGTGQARVTASEDDGNPRA